MASTSIIFIFSGFLSLLYFLYRRSLPRVIPGIPHNKDSAKSILGDVPEFTKYVNDNQGEVVSWWQQQVVKHNSPIVQIFLRPFKRPFVLIADSREQQDIMMRRTKEFDRSQIFDDIMGGTVPYHHVVQKTTDQMKAQKRLLADTMMPAFLNEVAIPRTQETMLDLVKLWTLKSKLADGHPFEANEDIAHATLDAIWVLTLGSVAGTTISQAKYLEILSGLDAPKDKDLPIKFPEAPYPPAFNAVITLTGSMGKMVSSAFPKLHHWFLRQTKDYRVAQMYKDQELDAMMEEALERFSNEGVESLEKHGRDRSAIDHLIRRELLASKKENREPQYNTPVTRDELFGFLIAGHDTTATTVSWGVKFLSDNQGPQTKLRQVLRETYPEAFSNKRQPTAEEISTLQHPYIDAFLEEILRCSSTASAQSRVTTVDTQIFGHVIPKDTDVIFLANSGFKAPYIPVGVEETKRSPSSQASKNKTGEWDATNLGTFNPERWLKTNNNNGEVEFDTKAGFSIQFGLGLRGCFGKKLAYIELRMLIVFIVWNFKLLPAPKELSGYRAVDAVTHHPRQCYVRIKPVDWVV